MIHRVPSIFNNLRPLTIGFDSVFDRFESLFDEDLKIPSHNYPPYDIKKVGEDKYNIEVALAGFNKNDIEVVSKENTLTVKSKKEDTSDKKDKKGEVLHKGISKRYFERSWTIADDVKVNGAELKDGLLTIVCEKIVPEQKKKKLISIS